MTALLVVLLLLSAFSGFLSAFSGVLVSPIFKPNDPTSQIVGWVSLAFVVVFLFFLLRKGIEAGFLVFTVAAFIATFVPEAPIEAFAGVFVGAEAFVFAVAFAFAFAFAFTVAAFVPEASIEAFALSGALTLVSAYVGWRVFNGDERDAWIRSVVIAFAAMGGTSFRGATLTDADFSQARLKSTDFRRAGLLRIRWRDVEKLDRIRPGETYLRDYKIQKLLLTGYGQNQSFVNIRDLRGLDLQYSNLMASDFTHVTLSEGNFQGANLIDAILMKANLSNVNFQGADLSGSNLYQTYCDQINLRETTLRRVDLRGIDLRGIDLSDADLSDADLSKANLSGANLSGANLSAVQALGTNFEKAIFTGACLKDLNINSSTNLKNVVCDCVYLEDDYQERRPHGGCFREGEFIQRFQQVLETVGLFFDDGVDWRAFEMNP